jgi:hypothetical protein
MASKCQYLKKTGQACDADAQTGKRVCVFHDPTRADDGARARWLGGINRSRPSTALAPDTPDVSLSSTAEVGVLLSESINQLRRGQLDPRVANAIGYLAGTLLKALDQGHIERRLGELEAVLGSRTGKQVETFEFVSKSGDTDERS